MKAKYLYPSLAIAFCLSAGVSNAQDALKFEDATKLSANINSAAEDVMPLVSPDGKTMYFVRSMHESNTAGKDGGHDIWFSTKAADGKWGAPSNAMAKLNNDGNNAVIGVSGDEVFLLNAYKEQKVGEDDRGFAIASSKDGSFGKPSFVKLPEFKSNTNEQGFYVTPDGNMIIMAVNSTNTLGKEDLYFSKKKDGKWMPPVHMGSTINSKGFEMSPYLSPDGKQLFFASDGHGGYGGADIFMSERLDDTWTNWSAPVNLGEKVNSAKFDAYLTMGPDSTFYFASNREGSLSDIYTTRIAPPPIEDVPDVVEDTVTVVDVTPTAPGMSPKDILFAKNESSLSGDSKAELDKIVTYMNKWTDSKCSLIGHTDVTHTNSYNLSLSKKRAKAAYKYLINKGISADRLTMSGDGENNPKHTCAEDACSEQQHFENRRVEFVIK